MKTQILPRKTYKNRGSLIAFVFMALFAIPLATNAQFTIQSATALASGSSNSQTYYSQNINGVTYSTGGVFAAGLPTTIGPPYAGSAQKAYVIAHEASGAVRFSTLLGGSDGSAPLSLKVANGKIYVLVYTESNDLPVTNGSTNQGGGLPNHALYILNETTGAIEFCTYLSANGPASFFLFNNNYLGISGTDVIVFGTTGGTNFVTTDGSTGNGLTVFVRKYSASGTIIYSKLLGGASDDYPLGIVNQGANTYILSYTSDNSFPVTDGSNTTIGAAGGTVLSCINASGALVFSKYISPTIMYNVKLLSDATGIYLAGQSSNSALFPTTLGSPFGGGGFDLYAMKYSLTGSLLYSRWLGGTGDENIATMVLSNGELYVAGSANGAGYPVVNGLNYTGGTEATLTKLNSSGAIAYSTYYGGDNIFPMGLDVVAGEAYLLMDNNGSNPPTTDGTTSGKTALAKFTAAGKLCMASLSSSAYSQGVLKDGLIFGDKLYHATTFGSAQKKTQTTASDSDPGLVIWDICPPVPTVASDAINPATQTVCQNGLVQQLIGTDVFLDAATNLPILYLGGVSSPQNNIYYDYQWQSAPSASGPWTDIANATEKNYSPSPTVTSTYFRRITKQNECCGGGVISTSAVSSIIVNGNVAPTVDAGGAALGILQTCPGSAVTIGGSPSASGGVGPYTYAWNNGAGATANPSVTPTQNSIYTLTVTDANGCKQADQVIVNAFAANAGPDLGNCAGAGVQIGTAAPAGATGISYSWSIISGSAGSLSSTTVARPIATPTVVTTYRVTMTVTKSGGGTCTTTDDVVITPAPAPTTGNFAGPDRVICLGSTTTLGTTAQAGFTYIWTPGANITATTSTAVFNPGSVNMPVPNKSTYTLSATSTASGCTFLDQVEVAVIEARANVDGCGPRTIGLPDRTPNLNETYQWTVVSGTGRFLGATNQDVVPVGASIGSDVTYRLTTTYTLNGVTGTCTDDVVVPVACGAGCNIEVTATSECPSFDLSGGSVTLTAIPPGAAANYSYSWSPAAGLSAYNTRSVSLTDNVARTYTVTITSLLDPTWSCTATKAVNNAAWTLPTFNATTPVSGCPNTAVLIGDPATNPGYTYLWTGVGVSNTGISRPTATAPATETYKVKVSDNLTGCAVNKQVVVNRTTAANAGVDKSLCTNGTVSLGTPAQAGYTYSWSPAGSDWRNGTNQFSAQPDAFVSTNTTFTLTQTHTASGCTTTDASVVTVSPAIAPFTMSNLSYCPGATALVLGYSNGTTGGTQQVPNAAGYTYSWSPSGYLVDATVRNPTLKTPMPGTPVDFYLTITSASGCNQIGGPLTITPTISAVDAGLDKTICLGTNTKIGNASNATGGGIVYSWSPATDLSSASSPNPTFTPTATGVFTFTVTKTVAGCATTDQVIITVLGVTAPVIAPLTVCSGTASIIGPSTVDPSLTYTWTPATGLSSTSIANPTATLTASQSYTLTITNPIGCNATAIVGVAVNVTTSPTVTVANINTCSGSTASFSPVVSPAGTYNYTWTPATNLSSSVIANPIVNTSVAGTTTYSLLVTHPTTGCYNTVTNITATVNTCPALVVNVSGNVFIDYTNDNTVNGAGTGTPSGVQLYVSLVNPAGKVVASVPVNTDGTYNFPNVTGNTTYSVVLSTSVGLPGSNPPAANLPTNWVNTAENLGTGAGNDGTTNGTLTSVAVGSTDVVNANFGISQASIGDKVYLDNGAGGGTANDGIQNGTEPGVAGVTVTLYQNGTDGLPGTADDVVAGTTVTDAYGNYVFTGLAASTNAATSYNVGFTLPANHQFTTQTNTQVTGTNNATNTTTTTGGSTAANGSDANVNTGRTGSFWLAQGEKETGTDAGLIFNTPVQPNSIGDRVWFDTDGNGSQNGTEPGISGVTVTLYASNGTTVIATTVTDAAGNYKFTNLPASTDYIVGFTPPAGQIFTSTTGTTAGNATTNSDVNATLGNVNYGKTTIVNTGVAGTQITGIDAGLTTQAANTASLGNTVWNDLNSNGTQDAGEPGLAGVTVNLYEDANGDGVLTGGELTPARTVVTDAFGNYMFNNLVVTTTNQWQVEFVQPAGFNNTPVINNNSGNDATDSDIADNATDRTGFIRLLVNDRNTSVDAGFVSTAPGSLKIGDFVFRDNDGDGQQDATEPGVSGITVKLYQNGADGLPGTADDVLVGTTTTDINGNYQFANLSASTNAATNYNVQFSNLPTGFVFTTQDAGADATDSDVNPLGVSASINLTVNNQTVDAGITQGVPSGTGSLGDKVWYDLNNNGVQDAGELGVAGVAVNLYRDANNDGVISGAELTPVATTATNALGEYMFTNLPSGTFQVGFTLPAALSTYTLSPKDAVAGTDITDSDGNPKNTSVAGNTAGAQTSFTGLITLGVGQDNTTVDLGIVPPASTNTLGGTAWYDTDSDGSQVGNPGRVLGVLVTLYNNAGTAVATTTTDENGNYLFAGLADGNYTVGFGNYPSGFDATIKSIVNNATTSDADLANGKTQPVTLGASNRNDQSLDVGLVSTKAALGNKIWDDLNGDGIQDAGEPGIPGVQVILYAADGTTVVSSTITDKNGNYLFSNLNAGTYVIGVNPATIPAGMQFTQQNAAGDNGDNTNSDVNTVTGKTAPIVLSAGEVDMTIDAGVRRTPIATVGNRVWEDLNGNGLQDPGEPGIAGVIATLYDNANQPVGTAISDGNGNWLITNVPTGTGYYVTFTNTPASSIFTTANNGGAGTGGATDTDTDSDAGATGQTGTFDVTPNTVNVKIDAGIIDITVNGNVFNDPNAANVNNSTGATNLVPAGMTAILIGSDGKVFANTPVGTDGGFNFGKVPLGSYTVILSTTPGTVGQTPPAPSTPAGWVNTGEFTGTPDTGKDPAVNGTSLVVNVASDVVNINFGIQRPPLAVSSAMPNQSNNGYSVPVPATQYSGSDFDNGTVQSIRITAFPTNAISITINGVKYNSATEFNNAFPTGATITSNTGGNPFESIAVQPALGNMSSIIIPYVTIDNAGAESPIATVTVPFSIILPVTGLNLSITADAGCNYRLNWQTLTEANVKSYVIQYSVNGTNWQLIGNVAAKGNSNTLLAYNYLHNTPAKGSNYYRIQVADKDGAITYSNTVQATSNCNGKGVIAAYPNPVEKLLTVTGVQAGSTLLIFNAEGKIILKQIATGSNANLINTSQLISGLYLLKAVAPDGSTTTLKVVKR